MLPLSHTALSASAEQIDRRVQGGWPGITKWILTSLQKHKNRNKARDGKTKEKAKETWHPKCMNSTLA